MAADAAEKLDAATEARRCWMGELAKAPLDVLEEAWAGLEAKPSYVFLRKPEIGLCMVRARAGGTGTRFNLGEMTMTRCAVRLDSGAVGYGYVAGRARRHAELAAIFDALLQVPGRDDALEATLLRPLESHRQVRQREKACKAAATKVEFFTLVRGGDVP